MKKIILCIALFCYSLFYSQNNVIEWHNTENGLPQNSIKDIIKDAYGFLWLSTEGGIIRYDGKDFINYDKLPINSFRFDNFEKTDNGKIINRNDYELNTIQILERNVALLSQSIDNYVKYNKEKYVTILNIKIKDNELINPLSRSNLKTKKGHYLIKFNSVIFLDHHKKSNTVEFPKETTKHFQRTFFTLRDHLFYVDKVSKKIIEIKDGKITKIHTHPILTDPNSYIIWNKINQQLFVLRGKTLYLCALKENFTLTPLFTEQNFEKFNCSSFYWDSYYKTLFVGTYTHGLFTLKKKLFKTIRDSINVTQNVFYTTLAVNDSSVICPKGRIITQNGIFKNHHFNQNDPFFIEYDHEKNIIAGKFGGVFKYLKKDNYKTCQFIDFPKKEIRDIIKNKSYDLVAIGNITKKGEILFTAPDDITTILKKITFPAPIKKLCKETENLILIGTIDGIYAYNLKTNKYIFLGLKGTQIRDIIKTKDGNIWITTQGKGIFLKQKNSLKKIPLDNSKNILNAHSVVEDQLNYLWIPTNNGLYRIEKSQILDYVNTKNTEVHYYRFTKNNGFFTNEFNGGGHHPYTILNNGEIVLPSMDGLVFFDPHKINNFYPKNGFYLERGIKDGKEIEVRNNMELDQKFNKLDLFIDVPYFENKDNLIIDFKHTGPSAENNWENINGDYKITLNKLIPGIHTITVRVLKSSKGEFYYNTLKIKIKPYLYQTTIFRIIIFLLVIALIYLIIIQREKNLQKTNQQLEEIVQEKTRELLNTVELLQETKKDLIKESLQQKRLIGTITHDITSPIKFISMGLGALMDKKNFGKEMNEKIIKSLHKSSSQLYLFSKILKEYSEIYNENKAYEAILYPIYDLVEEKKNLFEEIAKNNNVIIINQVSKELETSINKKILSAILHNLIDNAIKNTQNGEIEISVYTEEQNTFLEVKDTGNGISQEKIKYYEWIQEYPEKDKLSLQKFGLGLHLIIQLLQIIDGKLIIENNTPKGTVFKIKIINK